MNLAASIDTTSRRSLVVAPSWIGDAIMAQSLLMRLREKYPYLQLHVLAPPWVAAVFLRMDEISRVIEAPFAHGENSFAARFHLARQIAAKNYDCAYVLPNSFKSALIPFFASIPKRVGFTGEARYGLINCRHRLDKTALPLMAERFAQLAESPEESVVRPIHRPQLFSNKSTQDQTLADLQLLRPEKLAIFCPGAEFGPAKRWPPRHFASLADALSKKGYVIWLLGSESDKNLSNEIVQMAPISAQKNAIINLCGATSLLQAIDLMAMATIVVCNDSGLMHMAAALNRKIVALYGSSSPLFTPPLTQNAAILSLDLDCRPCFKRDCPLGHTDCLNNLLPSRVLEAVLATEEK